TWTGRNAVDPHSGDVVDQCRGVIDGPGEDLDLDPDPGQGAGELEHVDVHATGIAPTRARKRGGVHADHRQSTWRPMVDAQFHTATVGPGRACDDPAPPRDRELAFRD